MTSDLTIEGFGRVRQLGHVVADVDQAIEGWLEQGVGPWMIMRRVPLNAVYQGQPSKPIIDVALSYQGELQIELIRQHNDAPSPYRETIQTGNYGLHHQACLCDDIDSDVERALNRGLKMVCDIHMMGSRYVYLQQGEQFVELLPNDLTMRGMFHFGMRACNRWQGRDTRVNIHLNSIVGLMSSLPSAGLGWIRQQFGG